MLLLAFYLFLALFISFLCSVMEAVLLSTPMSYLKAKKETGSHSAESFVRLKENIDTPLSAILTLNTVAHTIGAAGVGAQATKLFGEAYFGIISAILTILILIFSEIIPKTIGARYWKNLSVISGTIIHGMIYLAYPLVKISALITQLISKRNTEQTTSREEFSALASIGMQEGILNEEENKIIQNIIKLKNVKVSEIMTPRVVVAVAEESITVKEFAAKKELLNFSRIPVYQEYTENITGYVLRQTVLEKLADDEFECQLKSIRREITIIPSAKPLFGVWETLLENKEHIALVVDEYGGMAGIITMEDIVESVLGFEILDETDTITDMQEYARNRWLDRQNKYRLLNRFKKNQND